MKKGNTIAVVALGIVVVYLLTRKDDSADEQGTIPAPPLNLPTNQTDFIKYYASLANQVQSAYGVPAIVTLAVAIVESASGTSNVATNANNLFGIKADSSWPGNSYLGYRSYNTISDSFMDYGAFLRQNPRYSNAFNYTDPAQFMQAVAAAGYSENPAYLNLVLRVMVTVQSVLAQ